MRKIDEVFIKFKEYLKQSLQDECGMGVIEVTLIVVVLVGLAILFKSEIESVASIVFKSLRSKVNNV